MEIFQMGSDLPPLILASYGTGGTHIIYGGHMGSYGCHMGVIWGSYGSYEDHIESYGGLMVSYGDHIRGIWGLFKKMCPKLMDRVETPTPFGRFP